MGPWGHHDGGVGRMRRSRRARMESGRRWCGRRRQSIRGRLRAIDDDTIPRGLVLCCADGGGSLVRRTRGGRIESGRSLAELGTGTARRRLVRVRVFGLLKERRAGSWIPRRRKFADGKRNTKPLELLRGGRDGCRRRARRDGRHGSWSAASRDDYNITSDGADEGTIERKDDSGVAAVNAASASSRCDRGPIGRGSNGRRRRRRRRRERRRRRSGGGAREHGGVKGRNTRRRRQLRG